VVFSFIPPGEGENKHSLKRLFEEFGLGIPHPKGHGYYSHPLLLLLKFI